MQTTETITATAVETTQEGLNLLVDGRTIHIPWEKCSEKLASATQQERTNIELSPGGYGIHWPMIDEDLSVNGLLRDHK